MPLHTSPHPLRRALISAIALSFATAGIASPPAARAEPDTPEAPRVTTYVVDRNDDANVTACTAAPNDCTLRGAINNANATLGGEDITFAGNYIITLTSLLPELTDQGTYVLGSGMDVRINTNNVGQTFRIAGNDAQIVGMRMYGAKAGASHIWIRGAAYGITIAQNVIGASEATEGATLPCVSSPNAYGGIYISSTGLVPAGRQRAYIWDNLVRCNRGIPGNGIDVFSDRVFIGIDAANVTGPTRANDIRSNKGAGVQMTGASLSRISANFIASNGGDGIAMISGTEDVAVGCADALGEGNMISGNAGHGLRLDGAMTQKVQAGCNFIGTDSAGDSSFANSGDGVHVEGAGQNAFTANTIAYNGGAGVNLTNSAYSNTLTSNRIGVNAALAPAPNAAAGISITTAHSNTVGAASGPMQHIAHNRGAGIYIGFNAANNVVSYTNSIHDNDGAGVGLDNAARRNVVHAREIYRNHGAGIIVWNSFDNTLGMGNSEVISQSMFIYSNAGPGVLIHSSQNTLIGYPVYIGMQTDGMTPAGNAGPGVLLRQNAQNNLVNANFIGYNAGAGVALENSSSQGNRVYPNSGYGNAGLQVDLGNDGPTLNDPGDGDAGPNTLLNYPIVTSISGQTVSGTACASCTVFGFEAAGNPGAPGGGTLRYVGSLIATPAGEWSFTLPEYVTPLKMTWMACSQVSCPAGSNVSELSPRMLVQLPIILR